MNLFIPSDTHFKQEIEKLETMVILGAVVSQLSVWREGQQRVSVEVLEV